MIGTSRIVVVIPTFNEFDVLEQTLASIRAEVDAGLHVLIINAGDPLPDALKSGVEEIKVDSSLFWSACVKVGFDHIRKGNWDWVLMMNADTSMLPGTLDQLYDLASKDEKVVAVAPAYIQTGDEPMELLYSHQNPFGMLLYGKLERPWRFREEAPTEPFEIRLTGGQGVLFRASMLRQFDMDVKRFPHTASDHDLWLCMYEAGYRLMLVPKTGIVNLRILSQSKSAAGWAKVKKLWWRMSSDMTAESWRLIWRLRSKHLVFPLSLLSSLATFTIRWTLGLPKILKRS